MCPCGGLVDSLRHHCFVCRKSIGKQPRHSLFNDVIWRFFARAKIQASKEPLRIFNDNKRPDSVSPYHSSDGKCVAWDVTVAEKFAASYIDSTASSAGAAAERDETLKTYRHLQNNYIFVPLACEVMASWSNVSIEFLDSLSEKITMVTGDTNEKSHLYQRISVALQMGNAACVHVAFVTKTIL